MALKNLENSASEQSDQKYSKKVDFSDNFESLEVEKDEQLRFDASLLKKKKKPVSEQKSAKDETKVEAITFIPGNRHTYEELLDRIQSYINTNNPDLQISKKYKIVPPQLARVGSKKIAWTNFKVICSIMRRPSDHVLQFVLSELGTEGSIGGDGQLTLKAEYVTCFMCKSPNTNLERDSSTRLYNITCSACEASRSVTTIKSGFVATSRQDRRKLKNAL